MAGVIYVATTTTEQLLASSSAKTLIKLISTTNSVVKIKEWGVFFDGILSTQEPVVVSLLHTDTSFGTNMTTHTPAKRTGPGGVIARSIILTLNDSCESGRLSNLARVEVHPQGGYYEKFAYGDEILSASGSTNSNGCICLQVNSPASCYATAQLVFEE